MGSHASTVCAYAIAFCNLPFSFAAGSQISVAEIDVVAPNNQISDFSNSLDAIEPIVPFKKPQLTMETKESTEKNIPQSDPLSKDLFNAVVSELEEEVAVQEEEIEEFCSCPYCTLAVVEYASDDESMPHSHYDIERDTCDSPILCDSLSSGYNTPFFIENDCCDRKRFFAWFSFLFWQAEQNFMDIAYESPSAIRNSCCGVSWHNGKVIEMDASFQPGFMIGLDYVLPCHDNWDISAQYTHLNTKNSNGTTDSADGFLYAKWIQPNLISNNSAYDICDSWQLEFNVLNLEIGRRCYIGKRFITRPYIGLAGAWIGQKFKGDISLVSPPLFLKVMNKSNSWAIGPRIGIEGNWYLTNCFSLVSNIATDILFTHYHLKLHQRATNDSSVFLTSSNNYNTVRQELEMYLGLSYEFLDCCGFYFNLQAGYDFQIWWDQNMIRWFNDITYVSTPQGNLYLQGLRATFTIGF